MKYSIIIPVMNNVVYTENFFKSFEKTVNHLEKKDLEVIVIDNGSTDGTELFLKNYNPDYSFSVIKNIKNTGVVASWNQGVKYSKGEKVIICNNDIEFITPNWLTCMEKSLTPRVYWLSPRTCYEKNSKKVSFNPCHYEQLSYGVDRMSYVVGCCFMVPKIAFETVGFFDEQFEMRYYEDLDYINRILQSGNKVKMAQDVLVYHAVGATSRGATGGELNESRYKEKWGNSQFDILKKQQIRGKKTARHFN